MYYGIDLGTTNSAIAYLNKFDVAELIENDRGDRTTPSVVNIDGDMTSIGTPALNCLEAFPEKTTRHIKNEMGKKFAKPTKFAGGLTPPELSAIILKKLVDDANKTLDKDCRDVVITVPAAFDSDARKATEEAGKIAGLNVKRIISEPTAAAVAYGMSIKGKCENNKDKYVFVYDLGGGTFDITLLKIHGDSFETIVTGGDRKLGGSLWDKKLADFLLEKYNKDTKSCYTFVDNKKLEVILLNQAEKIKKDLSAKSTIINSVSYNGKSATVTIHRKDFDSLTSDLLQKTLDLTQKVIADANEKCGFDVTQENLDFLLVGGSSRMPQVEEKVKELLRYEYNCNVVPKLKDPDACVAKGAAQIGNIIEKENRVVRDPAKGTPLIARRETILASTSASTSGKAKFTDVASHTYGTDEGKDNVENIIFANVKLPCKKIEKFTTFEKNQRSAQIYVFESDTTEKNIKQSVATKLECTHSLKLPPGLPEGTEFTVCFELDEQGMLHVSARLDDYHKTEFDVEVKGAMTDEEIEASKAVVKLHVKNSR